MDPYEEEELYRLRLQRKKKIYLYASFLICVACIGLNCASIGTDNWLEADVDNIEDTENEGHFHSGLFKGQSTLTGRFNPVTINYYTICGDGYCLWSCGKDKSEREKQLHYVMTFRTDELECSLDEESETRTRTSCQVYEFMARLLPYESDSIPNVLRKWSDDCRPATTRQQSSSDGGNKPVVKDDVMVAPYVGANVYKHDNMSSDGLLNQGLYVSTITFLAAGLLFSLCGSIFAIINTATTPVEAITGITGLYIWNSVAGLMELIAVILWVVQFNTNLQNNVLIIDYNEGWTSEGNEKLGYSFWLVVVSIILHAVNCGIIAVGTYEPKAKQKLQEPDKATNDILLY